MTSIPKKDTALSGNPTVPTQALANDSLRTANTAWHWNEHDAIPEATLLRTTALPGFYGSGAWLPIQWNTQQSAPIDMTHAANASALIATSGGLYLINALVGFQANATGDRHASINVNAGGAYTVPSTVAYGHAAAAIVGVSVVGVSCLTRLLAGDHIEVFGRQDSAPLLAGQVGEGFTELRAVRIKR